MSGAGQISPGLSQKEAFFGKVNAICNIVNTALNSRQLLDESLRMTLELFQAKRGSIFIMNEDGKQLVLKSAVGMEISEREILVKRLGEGIVGKVAELKQPLIVEDISKNVMFRDYKARKGYRTPSFICVPLIIKDKLIGVINIADKESGEPFSQPELQLLDFLGTQIALNFRRIQLLQKFKRMLKESKALRTELGKSSKEAKHLKKQFIIQQKFASIGKLAGGIAHEFNNPLDGVIRYTNLSLQHVKDDEVVRGYLLEVKHGLNRMANIVRNLLACSRNSHPSMQRVDVNQTVEIVLMGLQAEITQKNIEIERRLAPHLPTVTDMGVELILSNLVHNAIDAIDREGKIVISTKSLEGYVEINVSDTGCGFAPEMAEEIFEPFFTTKDIDKGCGLGLTIVHEIVKSYNGKIKVESAPQKGAVFTVLLPSQVTNAQRG